MYDANKLIYFIPQRTMVAVSNKNPSTKRNYAFLKLWETH